MARWATFLLAASMVAWTALTAATGWYMLRGGETPRAAAEEAGVVYDVAGPMTAHQVHYLTRAQAMETLPEPTPDTVVRQRSTGAAQPVPRYAQAADASGMKVRPANPEIPPQLKPPRRAAAKQGVIVLDPGHGRGDPGAVHYLADGSGRWDVLEADSNLKNAQLIRDNLVAMGYEVYLTRENAGVGPGAPLPLQFITSDLYSRVALAKSVNADLFLALHGNGATVHSISGAETWYCGQHASGSLNEKLARMVQQAMMDGLHEYGYFPPDRGIMEDAARHHSGDFCQFVVTREAPVPAALIEFLFLTNDEDAKVLADDRAHVLLARHVADAIDQFMRQR
jgi:N-acetylmuramoyl-L-alanine amidase